MRTPRRSRVRVLVALDLLLAVAACATTGRASDSLNALSVMPAHREEDSFSRTTAPVLTAADLASTHAWSTPEAIRRLRPEFLLGSSRAPTSGHPQIAVYLNGAYAGDESTLGSIPLDVVREVSFLHPTEARLRFGPFCACANGVILVATQRHEND